MKDFKSLNPHTEITKNFTKIDKRIKRNFPKSISLGARYLCMCICEEIDRNTGYALLSRTDLCELIDKSISQTCRYKNELIKHGLIKVSSEGCRYELQKYFISASLIEDKPDKVHIRTSTSSYMNFQEIIYEIQKYFTSATLIKKFIYELVEVHIRTSTSSYMNFKRFIYELVHYDQTLCDSTNQRAPILNKINKINYTSGGPAVSINVESSREGTEKIQASELLKAVPIAALNINNNNKVTESKLKLLSHEKCSSNISSIQESNTQFTPCGNLAHKNDPVEPSQGRSTRHYDNNHITHQSPKEGGGEKRPFKPSAELLKLEEYRKRLAKQWVIDNDMGNLPERINIDANRKVAQL